jgi:phage terminase small subunit
MRGTGSSIKEQKFVEHYAGHGNAKAAAIAAGYSKNGAERAGYRLLRSKPVQKKIAAIKKKLAEKSAWTRERAIEELEAIGRNALDGERPNHSAAVKAIETIAKLADLFPSEKKEMELKGSLGIEIKETVTFEDLKNAKDDAKDDAD